MPREHFQRWLLRHSPGQLIPMPNHSASDFFFPNVQSEPPWMQLKAVSSHPFI